MIICTCGAYEICECKALPDEQDEQTVEEHQREESRFIDRENAREINRRIE
jgi:hypothetical protein